MELVLISNEKGREAFLNQERINTILAPAIRATCRLIPAQAHFFPESTNTGNGTGS
jgi:hypothetical protein